MELYLRWLDLYERQAGEYSPIGLILNDSQLLIPWIEVYAYLPPARE